MRGGEIVDEKWKFSFQGALTSTVPPVTRTSYYIDLVAESREGDSTRDALNVDECIARAGCGGVILTNRI
jgi:hypothetical protein